MDYQTRTFFHIQDSTNLHASLFLIVGEVINDPFFIFFTLALLPVTVFSIVLFSRFRDEKKLRLEGSLKID